MGIGVKKTFLQFLSIHYSTFKKELRIVSHTHFIDSKGALVASVDLGCPAPGEVKELHQSGHHLVLLLCVTQPPIATKAPGKHPLLGIQYQLDTHTKFTH